MGKQKVERKQITTTIKADLLKNLKILMAEKDIVHINEILEEAIELYLSHENAKRVNDLLMGREA